LNAINVSGLDESTEYRSNYKFQVYTKFQGLPGVFQVNKIPEFSRFSRSVETLSNYLSHLNMLTLFNWYCYKSTFDNSTCTIWSDCAQLDRQWITSRLIMLHGMIIATTTIKVASATEYCAISQIQPEVFPEVTLLTFPATWRHFSCIIQLHQVS